MTHILIIILTSFIVYGRTIWYGLLMDDVERDRFNFKVPNEFIGQWRALRCSRNYVVNTKIEHFITILITTVNCLLIYKLFGSNNVSFFAALLYLTNPSLTQTSIWLNGKRYAITTMLILLSLLWLPFSAFIYPTTFYWQVSGAFLPIFLLTRHFSLPLFYVFLSLPLLLLIPWVRNQIKRQVYEYKERFNRSYAHKSGKIYFHRKWVVFVKCVGFYFVYNLFPWRVAFFQEYLESFTCSAKDNKYWLSYNKHFWGSLVVLVSVMTIMILNWGNPIGYGLFWWLLFIVQWGQLPHSITMAITERCLTLPAVGLMYAVSYAISLIPLPTVRVVALTFLLTHYILTLFRIMPYFKNSFEYYRYNLFTIPNQFRVRGVLSKHYMKHKQWVHALFHALTGLQHRPHDYQLNFYAGQCLSEMGHPELSIHYFTEARKNMMEGQETINTRMINVFCPKRIKQANGKPDIFQVRRLFKDEKAKPDIPSGDVGKGVQGSGKRRTGSTT